jgi:hypothetical protein
MLSFINLERNWIKKRIRRIENNKKNGEIMLRVKFSLNLKDCIAENAKISTN